MSVTEEEKHVTKKRVFEIAEGSHTEQLQTEDEEGEYSKLESLMIFAVSESDEEGETKRVTSNRASPPKA